MSAEAQLQPAATELDLVPFLDLEPMVGDGIREAILADVGELLRTHAYTNGPAVRMFERAFARFVGASECVGVASGLDALRLALLGLRVGRGDEVVLPALTFVATLEAVTQAGARPVVVDISEDDQCIDPAAVEAALSSRVRALVPVHLYGQLADVVTLERLARRHGLFVLEDACQAHGAEREGRLAGSSGDAAAFSFYPSKNLGALGDAGAVVTNSSGLADAVRALREHGQRRKHEHDVEGYTARLDTIQALVLLRKLPFLGRWNESRRKAAGWYVERLTGVGDLKLPRAVEGSRPSWHVFVVRTAEPEALRAFLRERGVVTARHYPQPPHRTGAYRWLGYRAGAFPVAEALAREALSLPLFPGITEAQLERVVGAVNEYFRRG